VVGPALLDDMDRIAQLVPELSRAEVEARVQAALPRAGAADAFVAAHGAELAYLLAENAEVRRAFVAGGAADAAGGAQARALLARHGSATLIRGLGRGSAGR
jgi:hypothetical protein